MKRFAGRFVKSIGGMSQEQWLFNPEPEVWNASEITEHLTIANRGIASRISHGLSIIEIGTTSVLDEEIAYLFYRSDEPPQVSTPSGTWVDLQVAIADFESSVGSVVSAISNLDQDPRLLGAPHPLFGILDAIQWSLFAAAHVERHRSQVIGLGYLPSYPH
ncbi:MAG: DinB family protein [Actinomycetota bacterium]